MNIEESVKLSIENIEYQIKNADKKGFCLVSKAVLETLLTHCECQQKELEKEKEKNKNLLENINDIIDDIKYASDTASPDLIHVDRRLKELIKEE